MRSTIGGQLIVAMERKKPIPLGSKVYREKEGRIEEVGKVVDIIGSVRRPYAVVKLEGELAEEPRELYFKFWRPGRERGRWRRK
ncbi:MAG: hypothetical protein N3F67_01365 [Acidilobaceae archaeon]|nr:hypothetical protein [Acidilobaceae archaeon]